MEREKGKKGEEKKEEVEEAEGNERRGDEWMRNERDQAETKQTDKSGIPVTY